MNLQALNSLLVRLALLALVLRALVPAGFMPANVGGGWFLQICPEGVPAAIMRAWTSQAPAAESHHAHHNHVHAAHNHAKEGYADCELSGGLVAEVSQGTETFEVLKLASSYSLPPTGWAITSSAFLRPPGRAPPVRLVIS